MTSRVACSNSVIAKAAPCPVLLTLSMIKLCLCCESLVLRRNFHYVSNPPCPSFPSDLIPLGKGRMGLHFLSVFQCEMKLESF